MNMVIFLQGLRIYALNLVHIYHPCRYNSTNKKAAYDKEILEENILKVLGDKVNLVLIWRIKIWAIFYRKSKVPIGR